MRLAMLSPLADQMIWIHGICRLPMMDEHWLRKLAVVPKIWRASSWRLRKESWTLEEDELVR